MKKKILAMLLALVMVISLLPVSALAAEAGEHDHIHCPGKDENHTLKNTPHAVALKEVKGDCDSWGYTVYQCPECKVNFADTFVEPGEEHDYKVIEEEIPADCEEDGKTAVEECTICGDVKGGEVIPTTGEHNWVKVEGSETEAGCLIKYECSAEGCDATKEEEGKHNWGKAPTKIEKEPTYLEDGVAIYTCEGCGKTKEVKILCEHVCAEFEEAVKAKDPTCTEDGNYAYQQCKECKRYLVDGEIVDSPVIPALDHEFEDAACEILEYKASTCAVAGYQIVKCLRCDETEKQALEILEHSYNPVPTFSTPATCEKYGFDLYACVNCGHVKELVTHPSLGGHTALGEKYWMKQDPTCTQDGWVIWFCENENCDVKGGAEQRAVLPATGCIEVTVTVPAKCHMYGYTYTYCAAAETVGCDHCWRADPMASPYTSVTVDGVVYDVTVDGKAVWLHADEDGNLINVDVEGGYDADNHTRDNAKSAVINPNGCGKAGDELFYCLYCDFNDVLPLPKLTHEYDATIEENVSEESPATCTAYQKLKVMCKHGCGEFEIINGEEPTGHSEQTYIERVEATCKKNGVINTKCSVCNQVVSAEPIVREPHKADGYASEEEALKFHKLPDAAEWKLYREGTCTIRALYISTLPCVHCGKYLLIVDESTGNGHIAPTEQEWDRLVYAQFGWLIDQGFPMDAFAASWTDDEGNEWVEPYDPTCTSKGHEGSYVCSRCEENVIGEEILALDHDKVIDVEAKDATCTEDGATEGWHCGREGCDAGEESIVLPKTLHLRGMMCTDHAELGCEQYAYIHNECRLCGYEYISGYQKATDHDMDEETYAPTCTEDGKFVCKNGCGLEVTQAALGHKDEDGNPIVDSCKDTNTVRICAVCEEEVGKTHAADKVTVTIGEKTCISYEYKMYSCADCGANWVVEETINGLADHDWVIDEENSVYPTFHKGGVIKYVCDYCGLASEEVEELEALEGLGAIVEIDNAIVAGAELVDSGKMVVTIKLDGNKVDVWGVRFPVYYDTDVLSFEKAEFVSEMFLNNTANAVVEGGREAGAVVIVANVYNNEDKQAQNITIDAEHALVKLYFNIDTDGEIVEESAIVIPEMEALNAEGKTVNTENVLAYPYYGYAFFEVAQYLDANDDGFVNLADVLYIYNIIASGSDKYDARVDINKDGVINLFDFTAMYDYLSTKLGYEDMVNGGVKVEVEEEV